MTGTVNGDADPFGRIQDPGHDPGEEQREQRRGKQPCGRTGRKSPGAEEIADIGTVGQREKQHLRNEQTLRTRRIAQGRQEECSPDRKQRFPPEAENRHSQQKHRIGHLVRKSRRLGEEQGGACGKSRVVRANMREVRCIVSGKIISGKKPPVRKLAGGFGSYPSRRVMHGHGRRTGARTAP